MAVAEVLSETLWSICAHAVKTLNNGYKTNIAILDILSKDECIATGGRYEALVLLKELEELEAVSFMAAWQEDIL